MIHSYSEEIREKRNAARIFWLIVFVFAGFLYFFFQGYYPNIDFRLTSFGSSGSVSGEERGVTIRSFGIVNVKSIPINATMLLNSGSYGNDEKKMVDYGEYILNMNEEGYLPNTIHFSINRERPYYIDAINLVRQPEYTPFSSMTGQIIKIDSDAWIIRNNSGTYISEDNLSGSLFIGSGEISPVGEGYFLSGSSLISYDTVNRKWTPYENKKWGNFMQKCESFFMQYGFLSCPSTNEIISKDGKIFTGVTDMKKLYFQTPYGIIPHENGLPKKLLSLSGITISPESEFVPIENQWYFSRSGSLFSINGEKKRIITPLEKIQHIEWSGNNLLIFGYKGKDTFLSFFDTNNPTRSRTIPFPDIKLEELRIWEKNGNFFIKTRNVVLLIYRGSNTIDWILDGHVITTGEEMALYEKDGKIWKAFWGEKDIE